MGYLKEFRKQIDNRDFNKFLQLWEEYCTNDVVDVPELIELLETIKKSELTRSFGQIVETALTMLDTVQNENDSYRILRLLIDLQNTNTPLLMDKTLQALKKRYSNDPQFNERLRLIGMRGGKDGFQGAISNYELLAHMQTGKFVFHASGWGTGEIVNVSPLREHIMIEFENVSGKKDISFTNAFKSLVPLADEHFLARRFANPDKLEKETKENPVEIIHVLLRDLGPMTAGEIKDALCELVIPENEWVKWWQNARARLKKDPMLETPENLKDPFKLRKAEISTEERLQKALKNKKDHSEIILSIYNFLRDNAGALKNPDIKTSITEKLDELQASPLNPSQILEVQTIKETFFDEKSAGKSVAELIQNTVNIEEVIDGIEIIAFKKRGLVAIKENRKDWIDLFLSLLFKLQQGPLKDYLLKELNQEPSKKILLNKLNMLIEHPEKYPEMFVWYFQKIVTADDSSIPFYGKEGQCLFLESMLVLLSKIESQEKYKDLTKKVYNLLSGQRYAIIRNIIQNTSTIYLKEFLLLASKCHSFTDHDIKILQSLSEVVDPSLGSAKKHKSKSKADENVIWTTEEGYLNTQARIQHLGTIEIIENAREVEAARALGDLRENSEYKFALEKRSRLQGELKSLSDQLKKARILTTDDVNTNEIDVGSVIEAIDSKGEKSIFTILGPWDANPDMNVLSCQSKLAQSMVGRKRGDSFEFRGEDYEIVDLKSYFDK